MKICCLCSIKCPILVNRGWVPRSWRDEFVETTEDHGQSPKALSRPIQKPEPKRHWWAFWSKMPKTVEVGYSKKEKR